MPMWKVRFSIEYAENWDDAPKFSLSFTKKKWGTNWRFTKKIQMCNLGDYSFAYILNDDITTMFVRSVLFFDCVYGLIQ